MTTLRSKSQKARGDEFPFDQSAAPEGASRRQFVKWVGASLAVASFSGCMRPPREEILPYVKASEYRVPGKAKHYATIIRRRNSAMGVVVSQIEGRPQVIEGNSQHPASLGGLDAVAQAEIWALYDENRVRSIREGSAIRTKDAWRKTLRDQLSLARGQAGRDFAIVLPPIISPTVAALIKAARVNLPQLNVYQLGDYVGELLETEEGEGLVPDYRLENAKIALSLDFDFFTDAVTGPSLTRRWAAARESDGGPTLHVIEPAPTLSGGKADHRRVLALSEIEELAIALEEDLLKGKDSDLPERRWPWYEAMRRELQEAGKQGVVMASDRLSFPAREAVAKINRSLGNEGSFVSYRSQSDFLEFPVRGEGELRSDLQEGRLQRLLCLGVNPVRQLAGDDAESVWVDLIRSLEWSGCVTLRENETTQAVQWTVPLAHSLEAWGDGIAFEGTPSIQQPLIAPLFGGESVIEILAEVAGRPSEKGYDLVKQFWRDQFVGTDFDGFWRASLVAGVLDAEQLRFRARAKRTPRLGEATQLPHRQGQEGELISQSDPFAEGEDAFLNPWLQELPHAVSKQAWGNAFWISPTWAADLGVAAGDWIRVEWEGGKLEGPALPLVGMAPRTIALPRGYGRPMEVGGAEPVGVGDRRLESMQRVPVLGVERMGKGEKLALAQMAGTEESPVREADEGERTHEREKSGSLYPEYPYEGYAWGMVIDLDACTGCSACMIACQSENNIPVVGKEQFSMGRDMNWIRLERYFTDDSEDSQARPVYQPVACMHCEKAPCEVVCPVAATTHSNEGVNEMTYNRCVGTRYCSNNCPYRARRFNFLDYRKNDSEVSQLQLNPNVTVRSNGVMEKCTYCIQRVEAARIRSIRERRKIEDGEIVTACQSICPAEAIVFGDINDASSRVSRKRASEALYALLEEEDTRPRTRYLPLRRRSGRKKEGTV